MSRPRLTRPAITRRRGRVFDAITVLAMVRFAVLGLIGRRPIGDGGDGPVVSLTSFGRRAGFAHLAIESVARGSRRPSEVILWLDEADLIANPPRGLRRLQRRGLSIRPCTNYRSHNKYFPYACSLPAHAKSLVTIDDDMMYPRRWLESLLAERPEDPRSVVCHRAHEVRVGADGTIVPYADWPKPLPGSESPCNFALGVGGVLYPPQMLDELREAGEAFLSVAPAADDVWLHAIALRSDRRIRAIGRYGDFDFFPIRGLRMPGLQGENVDQGGNDRQISAAYGPELMSKLDACSAARPSPLPSPLLD